ncbi:protein-S-isoprenylcysteine O-methyltransferase [Condylostylus longicornis]|uniref:protein-S-isoprenylcysteine O-methyltransferase n=1 Tax=Condylostylus longicornis TaxID=2530218 RepID=UPI00244E3085|nr:protein-S-isoprenylcysteine O-methyltransferase [Condylostylus longicornis]
MLCFEGKLSLVCFSVTAITIFTLLAPQLFFQIVPNKYNAIFWGPAFYYALINMILRYKLKGDSYQIGIRASFLGFTFTVSALILCYAPFQYKSFGIYGMTMSLFHYTEFLTLAWSNPENLSVSSFILNHSVQYAIAAISSWIEFIVEIYFWPNMKCYWILWVIGFTICFIGEFLRKLAMITAKRNFTHLVQFEKRKGHKLITHGIYRIMRHPSYVGWFWWSIGTQIILCNPICTILYTIVSWKFFSERIYIEEITLINFFGKQYFDYQKKVGIGIPFIKGYQLE